MTDYTKNASFNAKTGTTIQGAAFDSEFDEIATAIASKEDTANKGASNGYCGLDGSGLVLESDLPTTAAKTNVINTFTAGQNITAGAPHLTLIETGVSANNTTWRWIADGEGFYGQAMSDDLGSGSSWFGVQRNGITIDSITLVATSIALTGAVSMTTGSIGGYNILTTADGLNASNINTGSIGNAYVPVGAVTQHQASLTIAEAQITDGATLARVGANEAVTGAWTFSQAPKKASGGAYLHYDSATQSGAVITIGTAAVSGSPSVAGAIYIQHAA
jgi:hypothetical protein